ncbi:MAG: AAA family ATPase [Pirellulales bacterium]|nr:AAA family ATPase [Pirellulales bacterium]
MYQSHWGLRNTPFESRLDPGTFYPSATHEEALARLHFLIEQHRCLGLLVGEAGSGKSLVLEVFAGQLRRAGRAVAQISLLGMEPEEMLHQLASALGCDPSPSATTAVLWQMLADRLATHSYEHRDTALLLDDADQADDEVLARVLRLVRLATAPQSRLTVILVGRPSRIARWNDDLLELAELRVDVEPWDQSETEQYVKASLARAGSTSAVFDKGAVARLQQLTDGVPRRVNRLADLALIAGAGQDLRQIDAGVVQSAFEELTPAEMPLA